VGDVDAPGGDVLDPVELDPGALARPDHRLTEQVVGADVRQRPSVAADRRPDSAENECVSQG
jgi:hypothetical protein